MSFFKGDVNVDKQLEFSSLNVASCALAELFSGQSIEGVNGSIRGKLFIPEYQRPYTWGEVQMNRLLKDLADYFKDEADQRYYLGSVILHQDANSNRLNVIDGQQRITTFAILAHLLGKQAPAIVFSAPSSQQQIARNYRYLLAERDGSKLSNIALEHLNITLVVTQSEDDAYRFFETQNTGGVRLTGADIIKAHHLRATDKHSQDAYARKWEALVELSPLLDCIMKVRYWQNLQFKELPSHRSPQLIKAEVVSEMAEGCSDLLTDTAYRQMSLNNSIGGWQLASPTMGYAMQQPLNSGANCIEYFAYFAQLQQSLLLTESYPQQQDFYKFYKALIKPTDGTAYLKKLFDSAVLLYVSQFGSAQLFEASLWLFRMIYSLRISNQKTVKESSIQSFARDKKIFDLISQSFTHEQLIGRLKSFDYQPDNSNTDPNTNTVKVRFMNNMANYFGFDNKLIQQDPKQYYDPALVSGIVAKK